MAEGKEIPTDTLSGTFRTTTMLVQAELVCYGKQLFFAADSTGSQPSSNQDQIITATAVFHFPWKIPGISSAAQDWKPLLLSSSHNSW